MKKYWVCIIGDIDRDKLPYSADLPMRVAVQRAFRELTGEEAGDCYSGWEVTEKKKKALLKEWNK